MVGPRTLRAIEGTVSLKGAHASSMSLERVGRLELLGDLLPLRPSLWLKMETFQFGKVEVGITPALSVTHRLCYPHPNLIS